jgi:hypothetical protein
MFQFRILFITFSALFFLACAKKNASTDDLKNTNNAVKKGSTLTANQNLNTYSLINSFFGGTGDVLETPDCAHSSFGPHITQVYDQDLKKTVFAFHIHVTPDNDRCLAATDRQRNEIKTYSQSPDSLLAKVNQTMTFSWKFKLDAGFKPSPNFTHLHQLKAVDGDDNMPLITLSARFKSNGNTMELIHTAGTGKTTSLNTIVSIPLSDFLGNWVEVTEKATFSFNGKYEITIKRLSDHKELLKIATNNIDLWREGTTICRPKWGIYRSLLSSSYLRDETVYFNDFNITKI